MAKSTVTEAPYDTVNGNLLEYGYVGYAGVSVEWRKIAPFDTTLQVETFERGRSAARFVLKDPQGHTYPMFMRDMLDLLKNRTITNGAITDTWTVVKRGSNYGVALVGIDRKRGPAVQYRPMSVCRNCGRKGWHGFNVVMTGRLVRNTWGATENEYLKDANGKYIEECSGTSAKACAARVAKNADKATKQALKVKKITPEMRTAQKILGQ